MKDPLPKQKTRNEMKSQRNKKSIIKVHEPSTKQQTDFNHSLFFISTRIYIYKKSHNSDN